MQLNQAVMGLMVQTQRRIEEKMDLFLHDLNMPRGVCATSTSPLGTPAAGAGTGGVMLPSVALMLRITQGLKRMIMSNPTLISIGQHGTKRKPGDDVEPHYSDYPPRCSLQLLKMVCEKDDSGLSFAQVTAGPSPKEGVIFVIFIDISLNYFNENRCHV